MIITCSECDYFYECEGGCRWQSRSPDDLPPCEEDDGDWMPEISAEDYAEWTGKGWLYE